MSLWVYRSYAHETRAVLAIGTSQAVRRSERRGFGGARPDAGGASRVDCPAGSAWGMVGPCRTGRSPDETGRVSAASPAIEPAGTSAGPWQGSPAFFSPRPRDR